MADIEGFNGLPTVAERLPELLGQLVRKAALDIQANAQARLQPGYGLVTGHLKNSIYTVSQTSSNYPSSEGEMLPEVPRPDKPTEAIVAVGANYGVYVEFGTSKMAAKPYLTPAVEAVKPKLDEIFRQLEDKLGGIL